MEYYHIERNELGKNAKIPILQVDDRGEAFYELALEMISQIEKNNAQNRRTVMICPVGPVGQYPIFVRLVNEKKLSLQNVWFFNMDEYLTDEDEWIDIGHPLSFRGFMNRTVYDRLDPALVMPESQRVFPDPKDPQRVGRLIDELGGVDLCVGGIGINGHLAFNEPQEKLTSEEFAALETRALSISRETRAVNAIGDLCGAIEDMPKRCVTIGMREILSARRVRLGVFRDWHRAVVRRAAYGERTAAFPATLLQTHPDALIVACRNAAEKPY